MGTLTSCSFMPLNSEFRSNPVRRAFRERIQCHKLTRLRGTSCFFSRARVPKWGKLKHANSGIRRCFGTNDNDSDKDNVGAVEESGADDSKSNVTTTMPEEERGFSSEKSTPPSTSHRSSLSSLGPAYNTFQVDSFKLIELLGPEKVDPADVKLIKDKLFGYSTFWVTKEEPFGDLGEGILFLGNLRGNREDVFAKLQNLLVEVTGDKYNLFMVEEPNSESPDPRGGPRVSFGLLRKEVSDPGPTTLWQYVIALLLFLLTIGSSVELDQQTSPEVVKYFTDPDVVEAPDMELLFPFVDSALPLAYGVLGVLLFHEVGHFLAAFPKQVKLSIPFFIPNITLGSFGAITQFKSILPDRSTKVDISLAGPFAGAVLSFSMFAVGLLLSSNPDTTGDLVQVPSLLFQGSLLLGLISRATLGYAAMHAAMVPIHPLVIAGWCGLTIQAFNMLPVGCLDGGRAIQGAFGKNALVGFGLTTYTLLGLGVLGGPLSLPWGLYVLLCQRAPEKPCLNDVTEAGTWRKALVAVAIFLVVLTLVPVGDELAEELGIGLDRIQLPPPECFFALTNDQLCVVTSSLSNLFSLVLLRHPLNNACTSVTPCRPKRILTSQVQLYMLSVLCTKKLVLVLGEYGVARVVVVLQNPRRTMRSIHEASKRGSLHGDVTVLVTNKSECGGAEYARNNGIPVILFPKARDEPKGLSPCDLVDTLRKFEVDFVLLAGYLKLIPVELIRAYERSIFNIHPSLLPAFGGKGYYGMKVHKAVIASGARFSGPTIHFVDEHYDTGRILAQRVVPVLANDTAEDLAARVLNEEHQLYVEVVEALCEERVVWREDGVPLIQSRENPNDFR
ncbi:hypothetical protein ACSQ67_001017 [Phaseolus vulgaris]